MRSNSEVRMYSVTDSNNPGSSIGIKGLAVKETEIVVSHIELGAADNAIRLNIESKQNAGISFPCKIGDQITEATLATYFDTIGEGAYTFTDVYNEEEVSEGLAVASVVVSPSTVTKDSATTQQFTAEVLPEGVDQDVTWSIETASELSINASTGLVTIGSVVDGEYTVTATSVANPSITGTATLTVTNA